MFNYQKFFSLVVAMAVVLILVPFTQAQEEAVQVELTEFQINMPSSLPAGSTTFEVANTGSLEHNFEIEGQGIEEVFETNLQPGETRTLQVDLQPGDYVVYCPVGNHRQQGMELSLNVTEAQMDEEAATTTPEATETEEAEAMTEPTAEPTETEETEAMVEEATPTPTPQPVQQLPATGGEISPWSNVLLVASGFVILAAGLMLFAWTRRQSRS